MPPRTVLKYDRILKSLVGVRGFEPPAPASRTQCSTRLSYTPTERRHIAAAGSPGKAGCGSLNGNRGAGGECPGKAPWRIARRCPDLPWLSLPGRDPAARALPRPRAAAG